MEQSKRPTTATQTLYKTLLTTLLVALISGCGGNLSSGYDTSASSGSPVVGDGAGGNAVANECTGTGLAAVDLSGQCRALPQATMGALEATSG